MNESEVRAMRDKCYGVASSDANWEACKHKWLTQESIEWLRKHSFDL